MRFYGVPSEERLREIAESLTPGEWVFEDLKEKKRSLLRGHEVREKLKEISGKIRGWKEEFSTLARSTIFVFVHEPSDPKAFKIYDPSSLGCSTELTPPRWKIYLKELEGKV